MKSRLWRLLPLAAGALVLSGCLMFAVGDGYLKFSGTVRDSNGNPVEGARIEVINGKTKSRIALESTDASGRYLVANTVCPCDFPVEIKGSGAGLGETSIITKKSKLPLNTIVDLELPERP